MKKNFFTEADLSERIRELKFRQKRQGILLKQQFNITYDSMKPASIILRSLSDIASSQELRGVMMNKIFSLASSALLKMLRGNKKNDRP